MGRIIILLMLYALPCNAETLQALRLKSVTLEGERFVSLRDPYIPQYDGKWEYGAALSTYIDILSYGNYSLYYTPALSFRSANSQIREGTLNYEGGITIKELLPSLSTSVFVSHESRHCLECNAQSGSDKKFPLRDSYGMRLTWTP